MKKHSFHNRKNYNDSFVSRGKKTLKASGVCAYCGSVTPGTPYCSRCSKKYFNFDSGFDINNFMRTEQKNYPQKWFEQGSEKRKKIRIRILKDLISIKTIHIQKRKIR